MLSLFFSLVLSSIIPTPSRYPGLTWGVSDPDVGVEVFIDPLCPDCMAIWPTIQQTLKRYSSKAFKVTAHLLPLPYHTWAFLITRSILAVKRIDIELAKKFIDNLYSGDLNMFQNNVLYDVSEENVLKIVANYVQEKLNVDNSKFLNLYNQVGVASEARIEFKFAAAHGICSTPTVYVNGVETELGSEVKTDKWFDFLDPLF